MGTFEERKKAEEARAARKAELLFKAESRRNKLLGLWAADRMNHDDPPSYAVQIVGLVFLKPGLDAVVERIEADLASAGSPVSRRDIAGKAEELLAVAKEQVQLEN